MCVFFFFKQKTAYEMRISDWSSDVCSSDLLERLTERTCHPGDHGFPVSHVEEQGTEHVPILVHHPQTIAVEIPLPLQALVEPVGHIRDERSEERRVGKECVSTCRSRWSPYN